MYYALDITETAGHTFIIDGYDSNGKFHINWDIEAIIKVPIFQ